MTAMDEILSQIPMSQLAAQLGVDEKTAEQATRQALPALLGGMGANAQDERGAASLSRAIGKHNSSLLDGGVDVGQVDTEDGNKIVSHVFGANQEAVVSRLGGSAGVDKGIVSKLLPLLAPIVMSWLAKKFAGGSGGSGGSGSSAGGGKANQADSGGLGGLGDLLGGILGGGKSGSASAGGGLGDLLGGLLGGGRR